MGKMKDIIAISGKSGCGNSTISRMIAERKGYQLINFTFRQLALRYSMQFNDLLEAAKADPQYDRELDSMQLELARKGKCVLGSRLAIWLLKGEAITVYLNAGIEKRVSNIMKREPGKSYEEILSFNLMRDRDDHERFLGLYGFDNDHFDFADIVIDADSLGEAEVVDEIWDRLGEIKT